MIKETTWKLVLINSSILALAYFLLSFMTVMVGADLNLYLRATLTLLSGANPYDIATINVVTAGPPIIDNMPYVYSPASFLLFLPFASIDRNLASILFNALMAFCFGLSVYLLSKFVQFKSKFNYLLFAAVSLFGLGFPIFYTIIFGNPAPLECLSIIAGTFFLIRRKPFVGSLLFLPSIVIKLQPLALLAILLLALERSKLKVLIGICLPVALGIAVPAIFYPELMLNWIAGLQNRPWLDDPGDYSILRLIHSFGVKDRQVLFSVQLAIQAATVCFAYIAVRKLPRDLDDKRLMICLFIFISYMLMVPRLKPYAMLLSIPTLLPLLTERRFLLLSLIPTSFMCMGLANSEIMVHASVAFTLLALWFRYFFELNRSANGQGMIETK